MAFKTMRSQSPLSVNPLQQSNSLNPEALPTPCQKPKTTLSTQILPQLLISKSSNRHNLSGLPRSLARVSRAVA